MGCGESGLGGAGFGGAGFRGSEGFPEATQHLKMQHPPLLPARTIVRAMKEKTAITVNRMVGISITTAEPTLVPKKEIAAIQPLRGD